MKILSGNKRLVIPGRKFRKLNWGVAGCGNFTERTFLPTLEMLQKSKLVSLYSHDINRAKDLSRKFFAETAYNDFDKFLESNIDIVYIGSKNSDHYNQVIKAANAGKHILCEKPMALNSEQAEEMVRVCENKGVLLVINYTHRFHPLAIKARELIAKGMLGKIVSITASFNIDMAPNDNYRFKKELSGGGALWDLGTHLIDLLRFFGGEIVDIKGYVDNVIYKSEVDDFANALVKFEKSGYGNFTVSYNNKRAFNRIEILGYNGAIGIENLVGARSASAKLIINLEGEGRKSFRRRANKLLYLFRDLQKALIKNEPLDFSGRDGLVNVKLMEQLNK